MIYRKCIINIEQIGVNMKKFIIGFIILSSLFLFNDILLAQKSVSVGIVDLEAIYQGLPEARKADADLKGMQKAYSDSLETMQKNLMAKQEQYQKQKGMMPADQQRKEEETLQMMYNEFTMFRNRIQDELVKKGEELTKPILDKILVAINSVAKEEKINVVLEKGKTGTVLYFDDNLDITYKVLDMIKRGSTKSTGK
jgi:outer membrane protein